MSHSQIDFLLANSAATDALGLGIARAYRGSGGGSAVVYLYGELGAGKTTCVRSLLRELGVVGAIRSPTYTLVESYPLAALDCVHVDLYRIQVASEVDELGLRDYFVGECLLLVEWPERGIAMLPGADLGVTMSYEGDARRARLAANSTRGDTWVGNLAQDRSLSPYVSNLT